MRHSELRQIFASGYGPSRHGFGAVRQLDAQEDPRVADAEFGEWLEKRFVGVRHCRQVNIIDPARRISYESIREPDAKPDVLDLTDGPSAPSAVAKVIPHRDIGRYH